MAVLNATDWAVLLETSAAAFVDGAGASAAGGGPCPRQISGLQPLVCCGIKKASAVLFSWTTTGPQLAGQGFLQGMKVRGRNPCRGGCHKV